MCIGGTYGDTSPAVFWICFRNAGGASIQWSSSAASARRSLIRVARFICRSTTVTRPFARISHFGDTKWSPHRSRRGLNKGVISLVFNPVDHQSNKHIRLSCHFARELTDLQVIAPQRVATEANLADFFTKSLGGPLFKTMVVSFVKPAVVSSVRGGVLDASQLPQ